MTRSVTLMPPRNATPCVFAPNVETGALSGRDAQLAGEITAAAERVRFVAIEPHPCSHRLGPAPHSVTDLAAIFGRMYALPDWLEFELPKCEQSDDADEFGAFY